MDTAEEKIGDRQHLGFYDFLFSFLVRRVFVIHTHARITDSQ